MALSRAGRRIRRLGANQGAVAEKTEFGGIGSRPSGDLCVEVWRDSLVACVGPKEYQASLLV
jgi:hypothetical protein